MNEKLKEKLKEAMGRHFTQTDSDRWVLELTDTEGAMSARWIEAMLNDAQDEGRFDLLDFFKEHVDELYADIEEEELRYWVEQILGELPAEGWCEDAEDFVEEFLRENLIVVPPYDMYLDHEYPVDIFLDTGDWDSEFTINLPDEKTGRFDPESGVVWLAKSQGYSKERLESLFGSTEAQDGWDDESTFLSSLFDEVNESFSAGPAVTFLVTMSLREFLTVTEIWDDSLRTSITINRKTTCGLVDFWQGCGGPLGIELDKDVVVPVKLIGQAMLDGAVGYGMYGVDAIYGLVRSAWDGRIQMNREEE